MAPPGSITVLKSLLGAAGYLSKYVPEYAQLVSPLREMDDGRPGYTDISEEWYDYRLRALEGLKAALTTAPVLAAPDFSKPWILLDIRYKVLWIGEIGKHKGICNLQGRQLVHHCLYVT